MRCMGGYQESCRSGCGPCCRCARRTASDVPGDGPGRPRPAGRRRPGVEDHLLAAAAGVLADPPPRTTHPVVAGTVNHRRDRGRVRRVR
ncbi:hypothetical protein Krad_2053 [Kineococcus radiotolerans SRS30216 = ATCC BAA-149]|uniref:Uncharacterized protein n=1 Tax=Kineococcus radiotolerans (strain ATCC BAA-149 / DSM 14245 / SRS30216) TaxID=266940 RepID=A6W9P9_KINRD|nr:hypothetical protein Krad_2053 [Kineococcus radiotolerans SRS30216 = ATCC BAA-149]